MTERTYMAELAVENLAVVEQVRVPMAHGLVALTGETGVGKSIVVDAVKLLTGARANTDLIRSGTDQAVVEGAFRNVPEVVKTRLADAGIEVDDADDLVIRRVVAKHGGGAYINDRRVGLPLLAEVGAALIDILGQHAQRSLLSDAAHGALLDAFGGLEKRLASYRSGYAALKALLARIEETEANRQEAEARIAFLTFALDEIARVGPDAEADEALSDELNQLAHADRLRSESNAAYAALYGSDGSVLERLAGVVGTVNGIAEYGPALADTVKLLADAQLMLEEAADALRHYRDDTHPDPERQAKVEARLADLEGLKRKYGRTLEEVLQTEAEYRRELNAGGDVDGQLAALYQQRDALLADLAEQADALRQKRLKAAERLVKAVHHGLGRLAMPHARLEVASEPYREGIEAPGGVLGPDGWGRMHFLLAANPGEDAKPLAKVASGGELSRIMLALKLALIDADPLPCLIFDEVDTGIGGAVAEQVGRMLKALSETHQVFCVTHLPQIASLADRHLLVSKRVEGERTRTSVSAISHDQRVGEVARMLGGVDVTETTLAHAREMLG